MPKYYAVRNGRKKGIYSSWDECKAQTNGYSNAKFKSFNSAEEANRYLNESDGSQPQPQPQPHPSSRVSIRRFRPSTRKPYNRGQSSGRSLGQSSVECSPDRVRIYTDGACANNGFGGAIGGIGVHFPNNPEYDISEPLFGRQTNNRAEIRAATRAFEEAKRRGFEKIELNTDSNFLIQSVNEWLDRWKRNNWRKSDGTDVINKEDFQELEVAAKGLDINWKKVAAHRGVPGNEEADRLANVGVDMSRRNRSNLK